MQNPIDRRFLEAFAHLKARGLIKSQNKFSEALDLPSSTIPAIRKRKQSVSLATITKLVALFDVNANYILAGKGELMSTPTNNLKPDQRTELEKRLELTEGLLQVYKDMVSAQGKQLEEKDGQISQLLKIVGKEVKLLREGGDLPKETDGSSTK